MTKYSIDPGLYDQAVKEYEVKWRGDAEGVFRRTMQLVIQSHEQNRPQMVPVNLPDRKENPRLSKEANNRIQADMEKFRAHVLEGQEKTFELIQSNHRAGLIKLLTMENGLTQATAEKIVDKHVLIH